MLPFNELTSQIDEAKTSRMDQRTKPAIKSEIQKAAALLGVDESTFVVAAAYQRARETIADHERTLLSAEDRDVFLAALDKPAMPTQALRDAAARNAKLIRNGD